MVLVGVLARGQEALFPVRVFSLAVGSVVVRVDGFAHRLPHFTFRGARGAGDEEVLLAVFGEEEGFAVAARGGGWG